MGETTREIQKWIIFFLLIIIDQLDTTAHATLFMVVQCCNVLAIGYLTFNIGRKVK